MVSFLGQPYYRCCLCNEAFLRNAQFWSQDFLLKKNLQIVSLRRQKTVGFLCWWCFGWVEVFLLFEVFLLGIWSSFWPFCFGIFLFCLLGGFFRLAFLFYFPFFQSLLLNSCLSGMSEAWPDTFESSPLPVRAAGVQQLPKNPSCSGWRGRTEPAPSPWGVPKGQTGTCEHIKDIWNPQLCPGPPALPGITRE